MTNEVLMNSRRMGCNDTNFGYRCCKDCDKAHECVAQRRPSSNDGDIPIIPECAIRIIESEFFDRTFLDRAENVSDIILEDSERIEEDPHVRTLSLFTAALTSLFETYGLDIPLRYGDRFLSDLALGTMSMFKDRFQRDDD
jgi:hypothetical protein